MNSASPPLLLSLDPLIGRLPPLGPQARAVSLALGAVLLWATWPTLATVASPAPPFLTFGLAAGVGFVVSLALSVLQGKSARFFSTSPVTLVTVTVGLLTNNILYLLAMPRIGPAEANVIAYLWPVLLVAIMATLRKEQLGSVRMMGIALGFLGAAFAIAPTFEHGFDPTGALLAFLSGVTFAVYAVIRSYGRESHDVIGPSMGLLAVLALSLHAAFEAPASLAPTQWFAIVGIGVAPLTLSNALWDRAIRTGYTAMISGIAYLTPLAALLLLAFFGAGTVSTGAAAGAVLVVTGALVASGLLQRGKQGG
jgi:drug/metabolite transporter (DMT)-like permease